MSTSSNSINFVITAIYTGTFANSVFQLVELQDRAADIELRVGTTTPIFLCALMCMTLALRFFFGNNNFVDNLFQGERSPVHSAGSRLFHFAVIVAESVILLASSYLIRNPHKFLIWLSFLLYFEVAWFVGCLVFFREAVSNAIGRIDRQLALNELANLIVATVAGLAYDMSGDERVAVYTVATAFLLNTAVDLRVNLKNYMGFGQ